MNEQYLQELVRSLKSVNERGNTVSLESTGIRKSGGYTSAFEMKNPETGALYFLKFTNNEDNGAGEIRALSKVTQLFKNEVINEPDPSKRLGYNPVPTIITDDPMKFNTEFSNLFDTDNYRVQLQTAAGGTQAERELPESMYDRVSILLAVAKLLRTCAKNKIAYVDIKPLEHIFWEKNENNLYVTLIDWGIARCSADVILLAGDIRKYCEMMPEIIYGKKMVDLQYRSKLSFPIQKETRKALLPLLGQFSFNGELPPFSQEFGVLLGDLLSGNINEFRTQNRCIDIWDSIIAALYDTLRLLQSNEAGESGSEEELNRLAEEMLLHNNFQSTRDFAGVINIRKTSLSSHNVWAITALRFTQIWYGRIDLIPHSEFDDTIHAILLGDYNSALQSYDKLSALISQKIAQSESFPELRHQIRGYLNMIREVIEAQSLIHQLKDKKISNADFLAELGTSQLRVSDPILADLYYNRKSGAPQKKQPDAEIEAPKEQETVPEEKKAETEIKADPLVEAALKNAKALKQEFDRSDNFLYLRNSGFFQRLNEFCLNQNAFDNPEVRTQISRLFGDFVRKVDIWCQNIRPEKYFISDDQLNSVDWILNLSPVVYTCRFDYEDRETQLGTVLKEKLSEIFQALYFALAKEQTSGEPPEILAKIAQIKTLRRRLDVENLSYIRSLIDRGELESANQIINLHYSESPYAFEQLNNEISGKRKEQADQKTLAVINSVLNDLSSTDTSLETTRFLNSQKSASMISERFFAFKNRATQLFDIQDDVSKTKAAIQDIKKSGKSDKLISTITLAAAAIAVVLSLLLFMTLTAKTSSLERSFTDLSNTLTNQQEAFALTMESFQATNVALATRPTEIPPTPVPTEIPPTAIPEVTFEETPSEVTDAAGMQVPEADMKLESLMGKAVNFDIAGNVILYASEELGENNQLANIMNYAQDLTGTLVAYTDKAVCIESEFNIGRSQISTNTNLDVVAQTYIRQYSSVASETTPIFILQKGVKLSRQATDCTTAAQQFCHGVIPIWFDRSVIESHLH